MWCWYIFDLAAAVEQDWDSRLAGPSVTVGQFKLPSPIDVLHLILLCLALPTSALLVTVSSAITAHASQHLRYRTENMCLCVFTIEGLKILIGIVDMGMHVTRGLAGSAHAPLARYPPAIGEIRNAVLVALSLPRQLLWSPSRSQSRP